MLMPKKYGMMCLAIWLILHGVMAVTNFQFTASGTILAILAIVTGVLLWIDR